MTDPLDVPCPTCGAPPGHRCGSPPWQSDFPHTERIEAAEAVDDAEPT